jgi:hypothetical protein
MVISARARSLVNQALQRWGGSVTTWQVRAPIAVDILIRLDVSPASVAEVADAVRTTLGLAPGESQALALDTGQVDGDAPDHSGAEFRAAAGRGRICSRCGGVDEYHTPTCPNGGASARGRDR